MTRKKACIVELSNGCRLIFTRIVKSYDKQEEEVILEIHRNGSDGTYAVTFVAMTPAEAGETCNAFCESIPEGWRVAP